MLGELPTPIQVWRWLAGFILADLGIGPRFGVGAGYLPTALIVYMLVLLSVAAEVVAMWLASEYMGFPREELLATGLAVLVLDTVTGVLAATLGPVAAVFAGPLLSSPLVSRIYGSNIGDAALVSAAGLAVFLCVPWFILLAIALG